MANQNDGATKTNIAFQAFCKWLPVGAFVGKVPKNAGYKRVVPAVHPIEFIAGSI